MSEQNSEPRPPVPQYGEYAPAGYVPPSASSEPPAAVPNPYGVPGYAAPATPSNMYGPATGATPMYSPPVRRRRTWDLVLTIILLAMGLFGMIFGLIYAGLFSDPTLLEQQFAAQGYGGLTLHPGAAPAVLAISHVVLYLLAVGLSIPLLIRGRIVVFWIPLAIGVIAAIIFWATVISVILSDPNFVQNYGGSGLGG